MAGTGDDGKGEENIVFPSISPLTTIPARHLARHYGEVRENWGRVRSENRIVNTIVIQRKTPRLNRAGKVDMEWVLLPRISYQGKGKEICLDRQSENWLKPKRKLPLLVLYSPLLTVYILVIRVVVYHCEADTLSLHQTMFSCICNDILNSTRRPYSRPKHSDL